MRSTQRKTHIIETSTALGQNAVSVSSNPVLNQSVNVNINPNAATSNATSNESNTNSTIADSTNVNPSPYSVIADPTLVSYKENDEMLEVYKKLMNVYKNALLDDPQLTLNLIDQSGKIILRSLDLVDIIAHCCGVDKTCVRITYYDDEDVNCCCSMVSKINPIKEIQSIQIFKNNQNLDLMINFNGVYNRINDEFKISLNRVMVSIHPIAYV